jgi:hypothetical protein
MSLRRSLQLVSSCEIVIAKGGRWLVEGSEVQGNGSRFRKVMFGYKEII